VIHNYQARAESMLERLALWLNLVPVPLLDTHISATMARAIMQAWNWAFSKPEGQANYRQRDRSIMCASVSSCITIAGCPGRLQVPFICARKI